MNKKYWVVLSAILPAALLFVWGCQGNKALSPARPISLTVSLAKNKDIKASLLGSSLNAILYCVRGLGISTITGTTGPFASTSNTGTVQFSINMVSGQNQVLALQLNDATTGIPLAIGAIETNFEPNSTASSVTVEMGSVISDCYQVTTANYNGDTINFNTDTLLGFASNYVVGYDESIQQDYTNGGFQFVDAQANTGGAIYANSIAYMGNGNLVNFAYVPGPDDFFSTSSASKNHTGPTPTPTVYIEPPVVNHQISSASKVKGKIAANSPDLQIGDVYCIALGSIPGGYAWVQITSLGNANETAPTFIFRANNTHPYYDYFQTAAGLSGNCIVPPPLSGGGNNDDD